jgi:hypothetical protein
MCSWDAGCARYERVQRRIGSVQTRGVNMGTDGVEQFRRILDGGHSRILCGFLAFSDSRDYIFDAKVREECGE